MTNILFSLKRKITFVIEKILQLFVYCKYTQNHANKKQNIYLCTIKGRAKTWLLL